jgi:hypothetical protein
MNHPIRERAVEHHNYTPRACSTWRRSPSAGERVFIKRGWHNWLLIGTRAGTTSAGSWASFTRDARSAGCHLSITRNAEGNRAPAEASEANMKGRIFRLTIRWSGDQVAAVRWYRRTSLVSAMRPSLAYSQQSCRARRASPPKLIPSHQSRLKCQPCLERQLSLRYAFANVETDQERARSGARCRPSDLQTLPSDVMTWWPAS